MVTIKDLIEYRIRHETLVEETATTTIPLQKSWRLYDDGFY